MPYSEVTFAMYLVSVSVAGIFGVGIVEWFDKKFEPFLDRWESDLRKHNRIRKSSS